MMRLHVSESDPGKWCLGDRELSAGDSIEVMVYGKWYTARVDYDQIFKEFRFKVHDLVLPLAEDVNARWPGTG